MLSKPPPRFSIITSTLNAGRVILNTADSMATQIYRDFEWIVIDGGSADRTVQLLKGHAVVPDYLISEPDAGIYDAWNKALAVARGEWIGFVGAGDKYRPDALARYVEEITKAESSGAGSLQYISSRVQLVSRQEAVRVIGKPWNWHELRRWMCVAHVGSLHHRSMFVNERRFDPSYRICGDYELLLRCGPNLRTMFIPHITAEMLTGGASDSLRRAIGEAERAKISTGKRHPAVARLESNFALLRAVVRRVLWY
jgi:glycosyltransferase involved in cell wall biosynthesis